MTYAASDSWQSFVDEGWRRACLETKFTSEAECETVLVARALGKVTVSEALERLAATVAKGSEPHLTLLRWIVLVMLDGVPDGDRALLLDTLAKADPPSGALAFSFCKEALSRQEMTLLADGFSPSMPMMAAKAAAELARD